MTCTYTPYFKITVSALFESRKNKSQSEFTIGEIPLKVMSTQLGSMGLSRDDIDLYKADGLITLYGIHRLEVLLLETSSTTFGCNAHPKISFNHRKRLFGALSMLKKAVTDMFYLASIEQFCKM
ncbi:MAG: hypothetical protein EXX96DRAFT_553860, partial [Benjaminiella poitrasii]